MSQAQTQRWRFRCDFCVHILYKIDRAEGELAVFLMRLGLVCEKAGMVSCRNGVLRQSWKIRMWGIAGRSMQNAWGVLKCSLNSTTCAGVSIGAEDKGRSAWLQQLHGLSR